MLTVLQTEVFRHAVLVHQNWNKPGSCHSVLATNEKLNILKDQSTNCHLSIQELRLQCKPLTPKLDKKKVRIEEVMAYPKYPLPPVKSLSKTYLGTGTWVGKP
jgi:hypothetical protein